MGSRQQRVSARQRVFLAAFRVSGNVSAAAAAVGDLNRATVYRDWMPDLDFKAAFDEAEQESIDLLEQEARRRAERGVERLKVSGGKVVMVPDPDNPDREIPYVEREYSDTLMVLLLKAHRPERYSDKVRAEVTQAEPLRITLDFGARDASQS